MLKFNDSLRKTCRLAFFLITVTIMGSLVFSCKHEKTQAIVYDKTFEQLADISKKEGKVFCIVLSRPDCPPCASYVQHLGNRYRQVASKVIFNVIDVTLPENQWYTQWLCTGALPTTCIFSSKGKLTAVVSGTAESCTQCIADAINGNTKCSVYFYRHPTLKENSVEVLNTLLAAKQDLEKGKDISDDLQFCLGRNAYPYPVYLQCLNEEQQGRHDRAVYWAKQLLRFNDLLYTHVYHETYTQVKTIIDPDYTADNEAVLSIAGEVALGKCRRYQSVPFSLSFTNTGKSPLTIHDVSPGCSCLKLTSPKKHTLLPGQSGQVNLVFTPDITGEVYREVTFVSDAANALERIKITATVE